MKIQDSLNRVYQQPGRRVPEAARPQAPKASDPRGAPGASRKVHVPENFQPRVGLSRKEQAFFEQIFPQHRKQIQAYLNQQNKASVEKGQLIDMKG